MQNKSSYKVQTTIIDVTENGIPTLSYIGNVPFQNYNEACEYLQGEVNRLRNECGYADIPTLNPKTNRMLGANWYKGQFRTFAEITVI